MSNAKYYARRAAGLCPACGITVASGVYCSVDKQRNNANECRRRDLDRERYNRYNRDYYRRRRRERNSNNKPERTSA